MATDAFNAAAQGSNLISSRTDQGMVGDPNWQGPGKVRNFKEIYNYWAIGARNDPRRWDRARAFAIAEQEKVEARRRTESTGQTPPPTAQNPPASQTVPPQEGARIPLSGGAAERGEKSWTNLNPEFRGRLAAMYADAPPEIRNALSLHSGWRSLEKQAALYAQSGGLGMVARPSPNAPHVRGEAGDLTFGSPAARAWVHANARKYGMHFRLGNEPWHIEPDPHYKGPPLVGRDQAAPTAVAPPPPPPTISPADQSRSLYDKLSRQEADVRAVRKLREIREAMDRSDDNVAATPEVNSFIQKARRQRMERGTFTRLPSDMDRSEMDQAQGRAFFHHRVRGTGKIDVTVNKGQESVAQKGPFKKVSWHRHQQMTEASHGPPMPHDATGGGVIESPA
jgi:hypothetical protein